MNEKQIVEFCMTHKISVEQYFMLYLTKRRHEGYRQEFLYYVQAYPWKEELLVDLLDRGFLARTDMNTLHNEGVKLTDKFREDIFVNTDMGEELFESYPVTFPLSTGSMFVARRGMPKDKLIELYLQKISRDPERHKFVMQQLRTYVHLVNTGKINGHKISDWVNEEMWDNIPVMPETVIKSTFKEDI